MSARKVLITGASGGVGGSLLRQLLELPSPPSIRASMRDPSKANPPFPAGIEVVRGDLTDPSTWPAMFKDITHIFMYVAMGKPAQLSELMAAITDARVQHVTLLSSFTIVATPGSMIARHHANFEDALLEAQKKAGYDFTYTFLRVGSFMDNTAKQWGPEIRATGKFNLVVPDAQAAVIAEDDMAAVALVSLMGGTEAATGLRNAKPLLTGPKLLSHRERVDAISALRVKEGMSPVEVTEVTPEEWKATKTKDGWPAPLTEELTKLWLAQVGKPEEVRSSEAWTGKKSTTFEEWQEKHKEKFL